MVKNFNLKKIVYLGIGTNKGNREKNISLALELLSENPQIEILKLSNLLKNPPQEGVKTGYFLNGAIKILTTLTPQELLRLCKTIERKLGRKQRQEARSMKQEARSKKQEKKINKPRTIDLDILFYGEEIIDTDELVIPHPMIAKRYFVLIPLLEIAKSFIHPVYEKNIRELYSEYCEELEIA